MICVTLHRNFTLPKGLSSKFREKYVKIWCRKDYYIFDTCRVLVFSVKCINSCHALGASENLV